MSELPENWIKTKLVDVAKIIYGQSPPSATYNTKSIGLPFFQGKTEFTEKYTVARKWCSVPTKIAEQDDILLSIRAPVGPTNLASEKCGIGRGLAAIRASLINKNYLRFFFKYLEPQLSTQGTGTTFKAITKTVVDAIPIVIAPLNEQTQIVEKIEELFSKIDAGEAATSNAEKLLDNYQRKLLDEYTYEVFEKSSKKAKLGDVIKDIRYGTSKKCGRDKSKKPVLRIPNVSNGDIDLSDIKYADFEKTEYEKLKLIAGDILIVRSNGSATLVGKSALVGQEAEGYVYAGYLIRLRLEQSKILPKFLNYYLHSPRIRKHIEMQARSTSGVHNINSTEVAALPIALPSIPEQLEAIEKIESALSSLSALRKWVERSKTDVTKLRQSVLKMAFSGQLVGQDPKDEPASVLLERIRAERQVVQVKSYKVKADKKAKNVKPIKMKSTKAPIAYKKPSIKMNIKKRKRAA